MYKLYQFEISPFCDKIRRALRYKKLPFEIVDVAVTTAPLVVRRLHGAGKLPCLDMDGRLVADSTDIAEALEEAHPEPRLFPLDPKERALAHVLEDWADESLYFYEIRVGWGDREVQRGLLPRLLAHDPAPLAALARLVVPIALRRTAKSQGIGRKTDEAIARDVRRHVTALDATLEGRSFLVGDALTIADLAVFCQLVCVARAKEAARTIEASRNVSAWLERVDEATR